MTAYVANKAANAAETWRFHDAQTRLETRGNTPLCFMNASMFRDVDVIFSPEQTVDLLLFC